MDTKEVEEYLTTHKVASTHTSAVCSVLAARRDAIVDILKDLSVTGLSPSSLADFDWAVRVAVSSEKIADMKREPILMLSLNLKSADSWYVLRSSLDFVTVQWCVRVLVSFCHAASPY